MNDIADRYSSFGYGSIFIYTNEAHPGENYPHLKSMEQKLSHAKDMREILNVTRMILVDSLDGVCHRAYGSMPNMSWIISKTGVPVYKSDWTDFHSIEQEIKYLLEVRNRRRSGERLTPFLVERLDFRIQDQDAFFEGLLRNGPKAVREFREAFS